MGQIVVTADTPEKIVRIGEGTIKTVTEADGTKALELTGSQVRFTVACKYHNFRVDAKIKIINAGNSYPVQIYGRDGNGFYHTDPPNTRTCQGCAYKSRPQNNKEFEFVKELNHPAYTANTGDLPSDMPPILDNKYHTLSFIVTDESWDASVGIYPVLLQGLMDGVRYGEYRDAGKWSTSSASFFGSCARRQFGKDKKVLPGFRTRAEVLNAPATISS